MAEESGADHKLPRLLQTPFPIHTTRTVEITVDDVVSMIKYCQANPGSVALAKFSLTCVEATEADQKLPRLLQTPFPIHTTRTVEITVDDVASMVKYCEDNPGSAALANFCLACVEATEALLRKLLAELQKHQTVPRPDLERIEAVIDTIAWWGHARQLAVEVKQAREGEIQAHKEAAQLVEEVTQAEEVKETQPERLEAAIQKYWPASKKWEDTLKKWNDARDNMRTAVSKKMASPSCKSLVEDPSREEAWLRAALEKFQSMK